MMIGSYSKIIINKWFRIDILGQFEWLVERGTATATE